MASACRADTARVCDGRFRRSRQRRPRPGGGGPAARRDPPGRFRSRRACRTEASANPGRPTVGDEPCSAVPAHHPRRDPMLLAARARTGRGRTPDDPSAAWHAARHGCDSGHRALPCQLARRPAAIDRRRRADGETAYRAVIATVSGLADASTRPRRRARRFCVSWSRSRSCSP